MHPIQEALGRSRKEGGFGSVWLASGGPLDGAGQFRPGSLDQLTSEAPPLRLSRRRLRDNRVIAGYDDGPFIDAYRILREQVLTRMRAQGWTTLAITSPGPGEGKSLTAVNLAVSIAMEPDQTALLVDCNLRDPALHRIFGVSNTLGLGDYLTKEVPLGEMLLRAGNNRLLLLPAGAALTNSSELLASRRMQGLVRILKSRDRLRYVLFDLPPVLKCADMLAFAPLVDAAVLVIEDGRTQREDAARAGEYLSGVNLIGTVLNRAGDVRAADQSKPARGGLLRRLFARKATSR
jgi:protein-tyrosine kinase